MTSATVVDLFLSASSIFHFQGVLGRPTGLFDSGFRKSDNLVEIEVLFRPLKLKVVYSCNSVLQNAKYLKFPIYWQRKK